MDKKPCSKCGVVKTVEVSNFYRFTESRDGYRPSCKTCEEKEAHYYRQNPEVKQRINKYHREYRSRPGNKAKHNRWNYESRRKLRLLVLSKYGNKCSCCKDKNEEFLTLDHINGDGAIHRKRIRGSSNLYSDIKRMEFPRDKFRILCFNCHISHTHRGYCPHERGKYQ